MTSKIIRTSVLTIGENREKPRLWLEGKYLELAGFKQGSKIKLIWLNNQIKIKLDDNGNHTVSGKKSGPVIDINNSKLSLIFDISNKVRAITKIGQILITKTKKLLRLESQCHDKSYGDVFSGGGLLSTAMKLNNFKSKFAIEINPKYADVWQLNHNGTMHNCDISDIPLDELPHVEILTGGIPCDPFSMGRRNQGTNFHKNTDLSIFFLMIVEKVNPRIIILEEVPRYLKSEIGQATIQALQRMGYNVKTKIVSGQDYGELETRKRAVIIASTGKINFPPIEKINRTAKEILVRPNNKECEWFNKETKPWFFKHLKDQKKKGNNFYGQIINKNSTKIHTIPKRYFAYQTNSPIVEHPTKKGWYRLLTMTELKRLKGLPDNYKLLTKILNGEILNQGILIRVFEKIIREVTA